MKEHGNEGLWAKHRQGEAAGPGSAFSSHLSQHQEAGEGADPTTDLVPAREMSVEWPCSRSTWECVWAGGEGEGALSLVAGKGGREGVSSRVEGRDRGSVVVGRGGSA